MHLEIIIKLTSTLLTVCSEIKMVKLHCNVMCNGLLHIAAIESLKACEAGNSNVSRKSSRQRILLHNCICDVEENLIKLTDS